MIARLTVVDGTLTEYPIAEQTLGGWQNGVTFYPDEKVTKVVPLYVRTEPQHYDIAMGQLSTGDPLAVEAAQVHATLALMEQQRVANLITMAGWMQDATADDIGYDLDKLRMGVAGEVWKALGLDGGPSVRAEGSE